MHLSLMFWQFACILNILSVVCMLPSLGAFPTDEVAGPSQENMAAAIDLLADETGDNEVDTKAGD